MNGIPPKIQIGLAAVLCVGWVLVMIRLIQKGQWPLVLMGAVLLAVYGYRLYNLIKRK
jgi:hypothetical protein